MKSSCASRWCRNTGLPTRAAISSCATKAARCAGARRKIAKIIEPAFADRHHPGQRQQISSSSSRSAGSNVGRVMRMHAGGAPQHARDGRAASAAAARELGEIRPGHHLAGHARLRRPGRSPRSRSAAKLEWVRFEPMSINSCAQEPPPRCVIFGAYRTRAGVGARMRSVRGLGRCCRCRCAATLGAQEGGDLQAQILYAYQTEDTNQLGNLVQRLGDQVKAGGADAALRYHLAHAEYRFGLLAERQARARRRRRHSPTASIS